MFCLGWKCHVGVLVKADHAPVSPVALLRLIQPLSRNGEAKVLMLFLRIRAWDPGRAAPRTESPARLGHGLGSAQLTVFNVEVQGSIKGDGRSPPDYDQAGNTASDAAGLGTGKASRLRHSSASSQ